MTASDGETTALFDEIAEMRIFLADRRFQRNRFCAIFRILRTLTPNVHAFGNLFAGRFAAVPA